MMALLHVTKPKTLAGKFTAFLLAGLPSFAIAIPLNWMLVEYVHLAKPLAYALVMIFQISMNFFTSRWLVFDSSPGKTFPRQFAEFFSGIAVFSLADWAFYSFLIQFAPHLYVLIQVINVVLFSFLKFLFCRKIFEK